MYLIVGKADGHIEEKTRNKYLFFDSTDVLKNAENLGIGLKIWLKKTDNKPSEYKNYLMKIRFNSDDNLPLNKRLKLHNLTAVIRSVFEENDKYYLQVLFDECLHEL